MGIDRKSLSQKEKSDLWKSRFWNSGRGERIRTSDTYVPNVVLYQAELHPESLLRFSLNHERQQLYQRISENGRG